MVKKLIAAVLTGLAALTYGATASTGLIFNGNGGKVSYGTLQNLDSVKVPAISQGGDAYYCNPSEVTATRTGFRFDRWYNDVSTTDPCILKPNGGITAWSDGYRNVYAGWKEADYYVVFHANGGSGTMPAQKQVTGIAGAIRNNAFTRANYHFVGWAQSASGSVKYADGASICLASDPPYNDTAQRYEHHLYALWEENSYTISLNANGGEAVNPSKIQVVYGSAYGSLPPSCTRTGYSFAGWFTEKEGGTRVTADTKLTTATDHTLYAHWMANTYRVTFAANGGENPSIAEIQVTYDVAYGKLATCQNPGHTFLGWFTASSGGNKITADTIVKITSSQKLYAQWSANEYTVTLNTNGGDELADPNTNLVFGTAYGDLPVVARTGYDFDGWWTAPNDGTRVWPDTILRTAQDHALYAHWTPHQYTVTFDGNGGNGTMDAMTPLTYDEPFALTSNAFTRTGYDFNGWTDTNGVHYADGATVSNLTAEAKATATLTAEWRAQTFTVTFDACGGLVAPAAKDVAYDATYGELPTPTWSYHGFAGWWTHPTVGERVLATTPVTITSAQTLYAHWTPPRQFTVTFDACGGSDVASLVVTEGETYPELPPSMRFGYDFLGWFTARSGGERIQPGEAVRTADLRLYAQWAKCTSELSKALDTAVFYFVSETEPAWFVTNLTSAVNGSCLAICGTGTSLSNPAMVYALRERAESGQLSISWSLVCSKTPKPSTGGNLSVVLYCETGAQNKYVTKLKSSLDGDPLTISVPSNCTRIEFAYYVDGVSGKEKYYAYLDHLVWIPDESPAVIEVGPGDTSVTVQEGQTLCFKKDGYDITEFLNFPASVNGVIDLTQVTVKDEIVDAALTGDGAVVVLSPANPTITTARTIPGLNYVFREGRDIFELSFATPQRYAGDGEPWTPAITVKGGASAFYMIKVTHLDE